MKRRIAINVVLAVLIAAVTAASAQTPPPPPNPGPPINNPVNSQTRTYGVFTPTARAPNSAVTNATSSVALGAALGPVGWICNIGSSDAYVKFGGASVTASTTLDTLVRASMCAQLDASAATYLAFITSSGTTTLVTSIGNGSIMAGGAPPSSAGGSSAVTVADGADATQGTTTDAACATDNGTCTVEALLKRENQRLTSLLTAVGAPYQANGALPLPTGAATSALQGVPATGIFTNRSGTIAAGGTSQTLAAINASRKRIVIQNPCTAAGQGVTAESLYVNFTSAAAVDGGTSIELGACGSYDSGTGPVSTEAITINAATTAHKFIAKEM